MQSVSSRIWTRVAESISCEDNHYTTGMIIENKMKTWRVEWIEGGKSLAETKI